MLSFHGAALGYAPMAPPMAQQARATVSMETAADMEALSKNRKELASALLDAEARMRVAKEHGAAEIQRGLVVQLAGARAILVSEHSVRVEAFVCRKPDENHEGVYRFLLKRNRRLYGVAYTLDNVGDIYLVGRMALASVTGAEIDRVLGQVLEAVDGDFNTLLELGFRTSIQKEWEWRVSRGESLKNLRAFEHLIDDQDDD